MKKLKVVWGKSLYIGLGVALLLVVIDLVSKWVVQLNVGEGFSNAIEVIPNFFYINKSYNIAVAFSLGATWGVGGSVLNIAISLIMSFAIFFYYLTHDHKMKTMERVTAILLGAGAVGNLIDRAFYWEATTGFNGVIDFMQFYLGGGPSAPVGFFNPFATFNFADACLTVGIVVLLVLLIVDMIKTRDTSANKDPRLSQKPQTIAPTVKEEEPKVNPADEGETPEETKE